MTPRVYLVESKCSLPHLICALHLDGFLVHVHCGIQIKYKSCEVFAS